MGKNNNSLNAKIKMSLFILWISVMILIFLPAASGSNRFSHGMLSSLASGEELFTDAATCSKCHDGLSDQLGADVSYVNLWSTTMMRLSFIDPMWRAKVRSETIRIPDKTQDIEKKCVRCHAPMASEQATQDGIEFRLFEDGFASIDNPYHGLAMGGISCTLCHQVTEFSQNNEPPFSGNFEISDTRVAWGPFFPKFTSMMERNSGYWPEKASHLGNSEFCAKCHDLFTDYVDANGKIVSTPDTLFAEQTPYLEWLESKYNDDNVQCQDCHMTAAARTKIASKPGTAPYHGNGVLRHTFYTENTMMLSIIESMAAQNPGLDLEGLGDAIINGQDYLSEAGTIEIGDVKWEDNTLTVIIRVTNTTGHKLPTSIPIRRAFIHFAVYDQNGQVLFSSGDVDSEGRIIGVDADIDPLAYEPHYNLISSGNQVQVYEGIMGDTDDKVTYTLLRASHFIKDNRILPAGFDKVHADPRILPVGVESDDNFIGGEDSVTYQIPDISGSRILIVAELKDQTLAYPMITDLGNDAGADEDGPIPAFLEEYEHHKVHFEIIDSASLEVSE